MAIKFISVKCPECNASLPMEEGRKEMFCSYCGTKVIMYNENEYIYRHIDEAGIKQADAKRAIELKRIEYAENKLKERNRRKKTKIVVSIIIGIISVLCIIIGVTVHEIWELCTVGVLIPFSLLFIWFRELSGDSDDEDDFGDKIKIPTGAYNYVGKNLYDVEAQLKSAGFVNVKSVPLNDLKIGLFNKPNTVQSLTINGQVVTSARKKYSKNAKVVITYLNDIPRKDAVPSANSTETVPQVDNAANESSCQLYIEVDFVENYFFSKYNAELYLDDQYVATLSHGKYYTTTLNVSPGRHKLSFKEENGSNRGSAEFTVKKDSTFTCKIETTSSGIDVSNKNLTEFLTDAKVIMPDTVGMLYSEALEALKQAGLSNISYETVGNHFIWVDSNWLVQGQNIEAGTSVPKSEDVKLECISLEDYFKETYVGKNVAEIQKLAEEKGFTIIFQDKSDKSLDDMIESMDSKTKEDWVATSARQYTFTGSTAVVTVEFVGIPTPTPIPTNTPVPTASETSSSQAVGSTPKATSTPKTTQNPSSASYHSSNDRDVAKKGNTGVYAYKLSGRNYDQYCIIDFDKGYVYFFNHGNGDGSCARVKITSGDLNGYVLITWHDGGTTWQYALRFNYKNMPDTMIVEDNDHYEYKYSETNLNNALQLRNKLKITDY